MIGKYIDSRIFLLSLAFGLLFVYVYQPTPTVIYVYPTPDNIKNLQFRDKANNCFSFKAKEVSCPSDTKYIHNIPLQDGKLK